MDLKCPIPPKMKETHFKMMNIYPCKELLRLHFNINDNLCTFCKNDIETTDHIFFSCDIKQTFWTDIHNWIKLKIVSFPAAITRDDVTLGLMWQNKNDELCCNVILCLSKCFIHKYRGMKSPPKWMVFMHEVKLYTKSLELKAEMKPQNLYHNLKNVPTEMNN